MQNSTTAAPRVGFKAEGIDPKLSVGGIANGCVKGKVSSGGATDQGKPLGSAVAGFTSTGVKPGKV